MISRKKLRPRFAATLSLIVALTATLAARVQAEGSGQVSPAPAATKAASGRPPAMPPASAPANRPKTLDFEADVIEGQRKAPDLFLQTESQHLSPDAMIFLRNNFNDFHAVDRTRRPRLNQ